MHEKDWESCKVCLKELSMIEGKSGKIGSDFISFGTQKVDHSVLGWLDRGRLAAVTKRM